MASDHERIPHREFTTNKGHKLFDILPFTDSLNFAVSADPIQTDESQENYFLQWATSITGEIINNEDADRRFAPSTWDSTDIFGLKDTLITACTERLKQY